MALILPKRKLFLPSAPYVPRRWLPDVRRRIIPATMATLKDALGAEDNFVGVASTAHNYTGLTVVSNTNGAIVVTIVIDLNGNATANFIATITGYTKINSAQSSGNEHRTELWAKVGNFTGLQTIVITPSSTWIATSACIASAISVTGADQAGGATTFNSAATYTGTGVNSTIDVTTTANDLALAVTAINGNETAMTHTAIYPFDTGAFTSNGAAYDQNDAASPATFATTGGTISVNWDSCGVNIKAVGAATAGGSTLPLMGVG